MSPGDWGRRTIRPAPTPERRHRLTLHLADLYTRTVTPAPAATADPWGQYGAKRADWVLWSVQFAASNPP
jgi:hypothetical protein